MDALAAGREWQPAQGGRQQLLEDEDGVETQVPPLHSSCLFSSQACTLHATRRSSSNFKSSCLVSGHLGKMGCCEHEMALCP